MDLCCTTMDVSLQGYVPSYVYVIYIIRMNSYVTDLNVDGCWGPPGRQIPLLWISFRPFFLS